MTERHAGKDPRVEARTALREMRAGSRRARLAALVCVPLMLTILFPPRPRLVWNASASAPIGFYGISYEGAPRAGEMVAARVPAPYRLFAARRHYLPANVPLVKHVAAAPGQRICAWGAEVFVDGVRVATRLRRDGAGRPMPWSHGCTTLRDGALFLLMDDPASFDGRYFGPTARRDVIGTARPLWTR
jgi:conjugative transfer signal peptidase TraF